MKIILLLANIIYLLNLSSCAPLMVGAVAGTGVISTQERTLGDTLDDSSIWATIEKEFIIQNESQLFKTIKVKVLEGRVLMTGSVEKHDDILKATEIVWSIKGVKEVINELIVESIPTKIDTNQYAKDTWISTQIKSKLLLNNDVKSVNYSVITYKSTVYLFGVAANQEELDLVNEIAAKVSGVDKVISHIRIKDSSLRQRNLRTYKD